MLAWAFGSEPLYPVAVGLVLAVAPAWLLQRRQIADLIAEH